MNRRHFAAYLHELGATLQDGMQYRADHGYRGQLVLMRRTGEAFRLLAELVDPEPIPPDAGEAHDLGKID